MSARRRWIVPPGDSRRLDALVRELPGEAEEALREGRLFVGGRRGAPDDVIAAGEQLDAWSPRPPPEEPVRILARRGGVLVAYKPAGLPTTPDHRGATSLLARIAVLRNLAPGEAARLHAASRLDAAVSGVVVVTETPAGQRRVEAARDAGRFVRAYLALAAPAGARLPARGAWTTAVGGRPALSRYVRVAATSRAVLFALAPRTGRMHQLRVHAAGAGAPLLGDSRHGGARRLVEDGGAVVEIPRVMLHAASVSLPCDGGRALRARAPAPADVREVWRRAGGDLAALEVDVEALLDVGDPPGEPGRAPR